jgi:hypothetical protein
MSTGRRTWPAPQCAHDLLVASRSLSIPTPRHSASEEAPTSCGVKLKSKTVEGRKTHRLLPRMTLRPADRPRISQRVACERDPSASPRLLCACRRIQASAGRVQILSVRPMNVVSAESHDK